MEINSKTLNHLGLVSGMFEELGLGELIDECIEQDFEQRKISVGQACKAMVLCGLGYTQKALYLVPHYYSGKPVELLIGKGIKAEHLNDCALGRALDSIYEYGTTDLYAKIALKVCERLKLSSRFAHMDSTSFHLDGKYNSDSKVAEDSKLIHITQGYSRDHHPEANQVVLNMISDNAAGIPLHMEVLSGNASDKTTFKETIKSHISSLQNAPIGFEYLVMDSAGYTREIIEMSRNKLKWICRVPEQIKACQEVITGNHSMQEIDETYSYCMINKTYAGVEQRWKLIYSKKAFEREKKTLIKNYQKKSLEEYKSFQKLCRKAFSCSKDADLALATFKKQSKYIHIEEQPLKVVGKYSKKGKPAKGIKPTSYEYFLRGSVCSNMDDYEKQLARKGKFIIATNELDQSKLKDEELLSAYKGQSKVERGFRFMKDPQFMAAAFFVKKPERVEALLFIMTTCLTIYAALEYKLRQELKGQKTTILNQVGKAVDNPTMRWVFQLFDNIQILYGLEKPMVLNFKEVHGTIIQLLGLPYRKYYF